MRFIVAFLFLIGTATAADVSPSEILASVRVNVSQNGAGGCSGTIIAVGETTAYGLSASHCGVVVGQEFKIGFCDGSIGSARWKAVDRIRDLALFVCWSADVLDFAPVPDGIIRDAALTGCGFVNTRGPHVTTLHYVRETSIGGGVTPRCEFNVVSGPYGSGASGGGVFRSGCLVSVFSHQNGSQTAYGCTHEDLFGFLTEHREKLLDGVVAVQCVDGKCSKDKNGRWTPSSNVAIVLPKSDRQPLDKKSFKDSVATQRILDLEEKLAALESRVANLEAGGKSVAPAPPLDDPKKDLPPAPTKEPAAGQIGPQGPAGPPPTLAQIRDAVEQWFAANKSSLKGEPGLKGTVTVVVKKPIGEDVHPNLSGGRVIVDVAEIVKPKK